MKSCPVCTRTYDDDTLRFCLDDGTILSAVFDPQATRKMPGGPRSRPETTEVMGANRSQPQTIRSSAPVTAPWPPAAGRDTPGPASKKARRWPFLLIPVFLVLLIPVVAG